MILKIQLMIIQDIHPLVIYNCHFGNEESSK